MNYLASCVNSPIPYPEYYPDNIVRGEGALVFDEAGRSYIDLWMGYGALLYGHADPGLTRNLQQELQNGWFFSYPTLREKQLSSVIHEIIPCAERVRFGTSGSDAVAYAIRASRAHTGRTKVLSVIGGYHGVHENMISTAGSISTLTPDKVPFNDPIAMERALDTKQYACVIMEPILANNGCVPPDKDYLAAVRKCCNETGTVLVFDEVVVGFRTNLGGAQKEFGITPDMATFSKAIGGGLPLSIVCGKESLMMQYAPGGEVFFAGTFNGSPLALANASLIINRLKTEPPYAALQAARKRLTKVISDYAKEHEIRMAVQGYGSMLSLAFDCDTFTQGVEAAGASPTKYVRFANYMAKNESVLLPPLFTETIFLSPVHLQYEGSLIDSFKRGLDYVNQA